MKFNILDTRSIYQQMLATTDDTEREAIFRDCIVTPFDGLVRTFGGTDGVAMFKQWLMSADQFTGEQRSWSTRVMDGLIAYDAWNKAEQALEDANRAFAPY
ncbi:MAG TPA: hypothetical protein VHL11_17980, partial [Phototrophicaceae bacterium]|nr:hypothetical protein [Phototrophicaceae bacterium]